MSKIVIPENSLIHNNLQNLVQSCEMVMFAGLPGVGKSLLLQQAAFMAQQCKRQVHLLELDVIRPAFTTANILIRYPDTDGLTTHPVILKALGLWTRSAVLRWHHNYGGTDHILIGEAPLIGNRLMELAKPYDDEAEAILRNEKTQFVIPVPTREVRQIIERKRELTIVEPQHEKDNHDAPPIVLQVVWKKLYQIAHELGFTDTLLDNPSYIPEAYRAVYEYLLKYRNTVPLIISEIFEPAGSVHALENIESEFVPTSAEVKQIVSQLEHDFTPEQIEAQVSQWYKV